jgi:methionyl-tRNA formyltransferase
MRIVLFGFGVYAVQLLKRLLSAPEYEVAGVVPRVARANVDIPLDLLPQEAERLGVRVIHSNNVNSPRFIQRLKSLDCDLLVNCGHNQLFKRELLDATRLGCANIHPGLLPYGRGSGAIQGEILNGRRVIGQTIHLMDESFDRGEIVHQRCFQLRGDEYLDEIDQILGQNNVDFYMEGLEKLRRNQRGMKVHGFGTYYPRKAPGDEILDWSQSSDVIFRKVRSRSPFIPSVTFCQSDWAEVKVWKVELSDIEDYAFTPGQVLDRDISRGILVKTGDSAIWVTDVSYIDNDHQMPTFPIGTCFVSNWLVEISRIRKHLGM